MNDRPVYQYSVGRNCCLPTAMFNALTAVWKPHQIPGAIIRAIYRHALDGRNGAGTTDEATQRIVDDINALAATRRRKEAFRGVARRLTGRQVNVMANGLIARTLRTGGSAVVDVWCGQECHAMTVLGVNPGYWTFFDPCLCDRTPHKRQGIEWLGHPGIVHGPNVRIAVRHLDRRSYRFYTLGPDRYREAVLLIPR